MKPGSPKILYLSSSAPDPSKLFFWYLLSMVCFEEFQVAFQNKHAIPLELGHHWQMHQYKGLCDSKGLNIPGPRHAGLAVEDDSGNAVLQDVDKGRGGGRRGGRGNPRGRGQARGRRMAAPIMDQDNDDWFEDAVENAREDLGEDDDDETNCPGQGCDDGGADGIDDHEQQGPGPSFTVYLQHNFLCLNN
jgi:hypothetical protein